MGGFRLGILFSTSAVHPALVMACRRHAEMRDVARRMDARVPLERAASAIPAAPRRRAG